MKSVLGFMFDEARIIVIVILVAIVLPSILLSIFAISAIGAERSHVQDRIRREAQNLRERVIASVLAELNSARTMISRKDLNLDSKESFGSLKDNLDSAFPCFSEVVALGGSGVVLYPPLPNGKTILILSPPATYLYDALQKPRNLEFVHFDFEAAADSYAKIFENYMDDRIKVSALFGLARVYHKMKKDEKAVEILKKIMTSHGNSRDENGMLSGPAAALRIAEYKMNNGFSQSKFMEIKKAFRAISSSRSYLLQEEAQFYDSKLNYLIDVLKAQSAGSSTILEELEYLKEEIEKKQKGEALVQKTEDVFGSGSSMSYPGLIGFKFLDENYIAVNSVMEHRGSSFRIIAVAPVTLVLEKVIAPLIEKLTVREEIGLSIVGVGGTFLVGEPSPPSAYSLGKTSFPGPFDELQARTYLKGYESLASLSSIRTNIYLWAVGLAITGIIVGAMVTFFSVRRTLRAAELKSDFVSNVSHELKTPLTSIRMFAETLNEGRVSGEKDTRECLQTIVSESERLTRLIDKVLDFRSIEKGKRKFDFRRCNPGEVVLSGLDTFKKQMRGREAKIYVNLPSELPFVKMDPDAIKEILLNLLTNAYKYSRPDDIKIWVSAKREEDNLRITVRDAGIGIPKRARKAIFNKFYRVDDLLTREVDGTGLGLTISRHIAQAHGGRIEVKSVEGKGSEFTLVLRSN